MATVSTENMSQCLEDRGRTSGAMLLLVMVSMVAVIFYLSWWLRSDRLTSPGSILLLSVALVYLAFQIVGALALYVSAAATQIPDASRLEGEHPTRYLAHIETE